MLDTNKEFFAVKKLLLHICCGPCAAFPIKYLQEQNMNIMGLFYNPNIHPYQEYRQRLAGVKQLADHFEIKLIPADKYDPLLYFNTIAFREHKRCFLCYQIRLEQTAHMAKKGKFDCFSTSLLLSKRQNHALIKQIGEEVGNKYGIKFWYEDFRLGFGESQEIANKLGIYRQQYCGCLYSEYERFAGKDKTEINK